MQRKHLSAALLGAGLITTPITALAAGWSFVPSIGFELKNLAFDQETSGIKDKDGNAVPLDGSLDANLPTLAIGMVVAYDRFYAALKYENSFEANADSDVPGTSPLGSESETGVTRTDFSIAFGYNAWRGLNVFVGYLDGETELTPDPIWTPGTTDVQCGQDSTGACNLAQQQWQDGGSTYRQTYQEAGGFLGASYGWVIGEAGTISVSGAYAFMKGTYKDNFYDGNFKYQGDSQGLSLGVTWSATLSERVGYFVDLRRQAYDFDGSDKTGNPRFADSDVKTQEVITGLTAGIQWYL